MLAKADSFHVRHQGLGSCELIMPAVWPTITFRRTWIRRHYCKASKILSLVSRHRRTLTKAEVLNRVFTPSLCTDELKIYDIYRGSILFGTPHPTRAKVESWSKLNRILKLGPHCDKTQILRAEAERQVLLNVSKTFAERLTDFPVLTICESKKTNVSNGLFGSSRLEFVSIAFPTASSGT